jgi:hypothetical protein
MLIVWIGQKRLGNFMTPNAIANLTKDFARSKRRGLATKRPYQAGRLLLQRRNYDAT